MFYVLGFSISQYLTLSHVNILPRQGYNTLDDSDFSTSGESVAISLLSSCLYLPCLARHHSLVSFVYVSSSQTAGSSQDSRVNLQVGIFSSRVLWSEVYQRSHTPRYLHGSCPGLLHCPSVAFSDHCLKLQFSTPSWCLLLFNFSL